ncbi:hypothetical protein ABZT06_21475 [Streptomyces sp. NPDC005483]
MTDTPLARNRLKRLQRRPEVLDCFATASGLSLALPPRNAEVTETVAA